MDRKYLPVVAIVCIMIIVQFGAVAVVNLFPEEYQAFGEDTDDPINPLIYVGFIILFTGVMLAVMKYTEGSFIQYAILAVVGLTIFYVFYPVLFYFIPYVFRVGSVTLDLPFMIALFLGISLTYLLYKFPEWYVVDGIGIVMGAGIAAIFGMSFGILPVFVLLIVLAVYDFISVYKTKHMISLASGVMKMKLPVMLVIPKRLDYSFYQKEGIMQEVDKDKKRDAVFIGLGDLIIPGILAVSAFYHLPGLTVAGLYAPSIVAIGCIMGSVIGLLVLMRFVLKGNPQAGLPLLNSGAILGYVLTYLVIYQELTLGITYPW